MTSHIRHTHDVETARGISHILVFIFLCTLVVQRHQIHSVHMLITHHALISIVSVINWCLYIYCVLAVLDMSVVFTFLCWWREVLSTHSLSADLFLLTSYQSMYHKVSRVGGICHLLAFIQGTLDRDNPKSKYIWACSFHELQVSGKHSEVLCVPMSSFSLFSGYSVERYRLHAHTLGLDIWYGQI